MTYQIDIQELPSQKVAAIRTHSHIDDIPTAMASAYQELYGHLASSGISPEGPPTAVYSEVDENRGITVEICVPVPQAVGAHGRIVADELSAERVVSTLHRGPYQKLPEAYEALSMYMQEHHLAPVGWMREQYLNGPSDVPPEDFETLVQWPVATVPDTAGKLVGHAVNA